MKHCALPRSDAVKETYQLDLENCHDSILSEEISSTEKDWESTTDKVSFNHGFPQPDSPTSRRYPRLSKPISLMRPHYDVVVIGSGYGGGVAASKMARAGKSVAVLELGKEKWPGEYPSDLKTASSELYVSGLGNGWISRKNNEVGKRTGMYHVMLGEGQNAFVGHGLGGTSLINANVFLECDQRTLALSSWPQAIRNDPSSLDKYYKLAADMLQPERYPESFPTPRKLNVLQKQAKALGLEKNFSRPPQTTFFHDGLNCAGVQMKKSTGSGQDMTGVNDGSKNSVLVTYIADAWNWGAEIFCECEVRYIRKEPEDKGYTIFFAWHGDGRGSFRDEFYTQLMWVRAREICFLGAGALGTTEILLRSKAHGLPLSSMVGQKLSGNGDMLSFGYNTDEVVNGIGKEVAPDQGPCGPTITGMIDNRGVETSPNVLDSHVIQEGAVPEALAPLVQPVLEALPGKRYPEPFDFKTKVRHFVSRMKTRLQGPYAKKSSVNRMQTYLVMSHDSNEGILSLQHDKPNLQFVGVGRSEHVQKLNETLRKATNAVGGTLIGSPFFAANQGCITVHPLGGAIMSSDSTGRNGATNDIGQVFSGDGTEVHEGLLCVDGSIIPTALGVNPLATITALAERSVEAIVQENGWTVNMSPNGELDLFSQPRHPSNASLENNQTHQPYKAANDPATVCFTEVMEGYIHIGNDIDDFTVAEHTARGSASLARLYLSVDVHDVGTLTKDEKYSSLTTGTFSCAVLSKDPLLILRGEVKFFSTDESVSDGQTLGYELTLLSTDDETYDLRGYKKINSSMTLSASQTWRATTTLYTSLTRPDGSLVGKGVLRINWRNFASELKSMYKSSLLQGALRFLSFFISKIANFFFSPLRKLSYPNTSMEDNLSKVEPCSTVMLTAKDGIETKMKIWAPTTDEENIPILFIPGASVDDRIFSLPTVPTNTVEYFTSRGHRAYVTTLRFGITEAAKLGYTAYDARLDVVAAMRYVHEQNEGRKFYVLCHCVGAISTSMAILDGSVPVEWIKGMTVSQAFFKQKLGHVNSLKVALGGSVLPRLYERLAGSWFPTHSYPDSPLLQVMLDQILRWYPVGSRDELCDSTVCRRCSFAFGRLWTHSKLNHATHAHIASYFDGLHMDFLSHLTTMGASQNACDNDLNTLVTEENLERFRGLKILFVSGGANVVFDPETTSMNYDCLRERFGIDNYRRFVADGYGHLDTWMGHRSFLDVYPKVLEHVLETSEDWTLV